MTAAMPSGSATAPGSARAAAARPRRARGSTWATATGSTNPLRARQVDAAPVRQLGHGEHRDLMERVLVVQRRDEHAARLGEHALRELDPLDRGDVLGERRDVERRPPSPSRIAIALISSQRCSPVSRTTLRTIIGSGSVVEVPRPHAREARRAGAAARPRRTSRRGPSSPPGAGRAAVVRGDAQQVERGVVGVDEAAVGGADVTPSIIPSTIARNRRSASSRLGAQAGVLERERDPVGEHLGEAQVARAEPAPGRADAIRSVPIVRPRACSGTLEGRSVADASGALDGDVSAHAARPPRTGVLVA